MQHWVRLGKLKFNTISFYSNTGIYEFTFRKMKKKKETVFFFLKFLMSHQKNSKCDSFNQILSKKYSLAKGLDDHWIYLSQMEKLKMLIECQN